VSEMGDDFRKHRERVKQAKAQHSTLCWRCGTRIWDSDPNCRYCGEPNADTTGEVKPT